MLKAFSSRLLPTLRCIFICTIPGRHSTGTRKSSGWMAVTLPISLVSIHAANWSRLLGRQAGSQRSNCTPVPAREWASFDSSYTNTPQEYAGWGAGLFREPALKVTFADGNRDLVLHYESHAEIADGFDVVLKDISRPHLCNAALRDRS